jgi:nucleotide-binding universal stress UspA family protein
MEVAMSGVTDGIVVGYDGSPGSAEALRWAAREAWARRTVLTICLTWRPDDLALAGDPEAGGQARQRVEQIIARAVGLLNGSPASQAALAFAFEEATLRDAPLIAVCALADAPGRLGAAQQMEEDFSHLMTRYEKEHPEVTVLRQVESGPPRSALLAAATGAQVLAVGSRGLGGLEGMSLGSVAATLLHHSPCPVAVVHPPGR